MTTSKPVRCSAACSQATAKTLPSTSHQSTARWFSTRSPTTRDIQSDDSSLSGEAILNVDTRAETDSSDANSDHENEDQNYESGSEIHSSELSTEMSTAAQHASTPSLPRLLRQRATLGHFLPLLSFLLRSLLSPKMTYHSKLLKERDI